MNPRSPYFHHHHHHHHHNPRYVPPSNPNSIPFSQNPNFYSSSSSTHHPHSYHLHLHRPTNYTVVSPYIRPPPPPPPVQLQPPSLPQLAQFVTNPNSNWDRSPNYPIHNDGNHLRVPDYPRGLPEFEHEREGNRIEFRGYQGKVYDRDWNSRVKSREDEGVRLIRDFRVGYEGQRGFPEEEYLVLGCDQRLVGEREVLRDSRDQFVEVGGDGDGVWELSEKVEIYRGRESELEFQRHGSKGSRETGQEFNRTPRKQMQKKSAFLRIQKPSYKRREDEKVHYLGHFNDARSSSFRGKDQNSRLESGEVAAEGAERSLVELDVSFKSNSLVAKAIVAPSLSSVVSDTSLKPRTSKLREPSVTDKDGLRWSPIKPSDGAMKSENSVPAPKSSSKSDKSLERSSMDVIASDNTGVCDDSLLTGSGNTNLTPRTSRFKKVRVPKKGSLKLSPSKPSDGAVKSENLLPAPNSTGNSDNGPKQVSKDIKACVSDGVSDITSVLLGKEKFEVSNKVTSLASPGSISVFLEKDKVESYTRGSSPTGSGTSNCLHGNDKVDMSTKHSASDDHGKDLVSTKTSLVKVVKKKKVVKRVVKKVVDPKLSSSNSQPEKECAEPMMEDSAAHRPPTSSEPDNIAAMVSLDTLDSHLPPNAAICDNCKGEEAAGDTVIEKVCSGNDSGRCVISNIKRKRSRSTSPLGYFSQEGAGSDECLVTGNNIKDLIAVSHCQEDSYEFLNEITSSGIGIVVCNKLCPNGEFISTKNDNSRDCPQALCFLEDNACVGCLSSESTAICKVPLSSSGNTIVFDNSLTNQQRGNTDIDVNISAAGLVSQCGQLCASTGEGPPEDARFPAESGDIFHLSISEESGAPRVAIPVDSSDYGVDRKLGSDNCFTDSERINSSSIVDVEGITTLSSMDEVSQLFQSVPLGGSLSTVDGSKGVIVEENVEYVRGPQLDLLSSEIKDSCIVSRINSSHWVDTTLRLSFKNSSQAGSPVSVDRFTDVGPDCCKGGIDILPQNNSTDHSGVLLGSTVNDVPCGSLARKQKIKCLASELELSSPLTFDNKGAVSSGVSMLGVDISCHCEDLTQKEEEVPLCSMDLVCSLSPSAAEPINGPPESCSPERFLNTNASLKGDNSINNGLGGVHVCSTVEGLDSQELQMLPMMELRNVQIGKVSPEQGGNQKNGSLDFESGEGGNLDMDAAEERAFDSKNAHSQNSLGLQSPDFERSPSRAVEDDVYDSEKHDLTFCSTYQFPLRDSNGTATNSGDILMETLHDTILDVVSPGNLPNVPGMLVEKSDEDDTILNEKHEVVQGSSLIQMNFDVNKVDTTVKFDQPLNGSSAPLPLQDSGDSSLICSATRAEAHQRKNQPTKKMSNTYSGSSSLVLAASRKAASSAFPAKPRTWHRTDNSSASTSLGNSTLPSYVSFQRQLPKNVTRKFPSNSYVRKGNSLVRKASPSVTESLVSHGCNSGKQSSSSNTDQMKENVASDHGYVATDLLNFVKAGGTGSLVKRPSTPPLSIISNVPNSIANSIDNCILSVKADLIREVCTETASVPAVVTSRNPLPRSSENFLGFLETSVKQADPVNSLEYQGEQHGGNSVLLNVKNVTYVKRKSNQLVASSVLPAGAHNTTAFASNNYYKRRKNQLVRTSVDSRVKPKTSKGNESLNLERKVVVDNISSISFSKRRLHKVFKKIYKPSKFSLVWTLRGSQSAKPLHYRHVLPQLFPWKRATYWRNFFPNLSTNSNMIRKLMLFKSRDTLYTRSKHGFSLRKLKESSVGGSSLKWSKSIGTHLNDSIEEATLSVAAADRKKRDQKGERIFRIGLVRYKMDSSKRTLQRISDDDSPFSDSLQAEEEVKKPYVPRRLVIGSHEYVRIGNGNQLIRDPKKRTRILASEKVRWSLHTVRSRLAKKRKYCLFYTRFGKCNKDTRKCPYIHDPSKIAVCTKFLNGLCPNPECKLTHKVIPERMPDCSYFLQGLCNNKNCPYRHVHVNPNASTCEGFLKGYCADGDECRKKHSYVCTIYEATGSCPQGSKCKLHHPKSRSKGKKTKQLLQGNAQTRYFGSMHMNAFDSGVAVSGKESTVNHGDKFVGDLPDYISINMSNGETIGCDNLINEKATQSDTDSLDLQLDDLDGLIKPFRIMNI